MRTGELSAISSSIREGKRISCLLVSEIKCTFFVKKCQLTYEFGYKIDFCDFDKKNAQNSAPSVSINFSNTSCC